MTSNAAPAGADTWQQIQAEIRANLTPQAFSNWFERTEAAAHPDGSITLTAASEPAAHLIDQEYSGLLASLAARYGVPSIAVTAPAADAPPTAPATPAVTRVSVIGSSAQPAAHRKSALATLADLAPTLKESELRLALYMAAQAEDRQHNSLRASSRNIAQALNMARDAVQRALDALAHRRLITIRAGTPKAPSAYILHFLDLATIARPQEGGCLKQPPSRPPAVFDSQGVAALNSHGGCFVQPPLIENEALPAPPAPLDIDNDSTIEVLDRVLSARPSNFSRESLATARAWLVGYVTKVGQRNALDPDDRILAQFLTVADWQTLEAMLYDLFHQSIRPGDRYVWFVAVALQRIHGIAPTVLQQRRSHLKLVKRGQPPADPPAAGDLAASAAAAARSL